jgi:superfamily II DNA or RNA helicase
MWAQMRSIMYQMPTGTGKTKLFVSIARDLFDWGIAKKIQIKILFLAHRIELIDQISENLGAKYHLAHGLIASGNREQKFYGLQVGSVQTLVRRLEKWEDKDFDFVIIDEAHHVKADSYKKILKTFPKAKVLGVTATPYRMSHESFRPEFDELITSMSE